MKLSDLNFEDKLIYLRNMHAKSHPDVQEQVGRWELDFARFKAKKEWLEHPNTKEMYALAITQLRSITRALMFDGLSVEQRTEFHQLRKAHEAYLSLLTGDTAESLETSMEHIESLVVDEIKNYE